MPRTYTLTHYSRFPRVDTLERNLGMNTKTTVAVRPGEKLTYVGEFNSLNDIVLTSKDEEIVVPKSHLAELP